MTSSDKTSLTVVKQGFVIATLDERPALLIEHNDWKMLKGMLKRLKEPVKVYETLAGVAGGASISKWLQLIQTNFPQGWINSALGAWALALLLATVLLFLLAREQSKVSSQRAVDILEFTHSIEAKSQVSESNE